MEGERGKAWSRHQTDIWTAAEEGFPDPSMSPEERLEYVREKQRLDGDPEAWAASYECSFLSAAGAYIRAEEWDPVATNEQFSLFAAYQRSRHGDGDMAKMDFLDYQALVRRIPGPDHVYDYIVRLVAMASTPHGDRPILKEALAYLGRHETRGASEGTD